MRRRRKKPVKFNFSLDDTSFDYKLVFSFSIPSDKFFLALSEWKIYKDGLISENDVERWGTDDEKVCRFFYNHFVKKRLKNVMKKVRNKLKKEGFKSFSFVTAGVKRVEWIRHGDMIDVNVNVEGTCAYEKP